MFDEGSIMAIGLCSLGSLMNEEVALRKEVQVHTERLARAATVARSLCACAPTAEEVQATAGLAANCRLAAEAIRELQAEDSAAASAAAAEGEAEPTGADTRASLEADDVSGKGIEAGAYSLDARACASAVPSEEAIASHASLDGDEDDMPCPPGLPPYIDGP